MKKLARGELRFLPKKLDKIFRVYDRSGGSFPYRTNELGIVRQDLPELDIQAECDRLNTKFVGAARAAAPLVKTVEADRSAGDIEPSTNSKKARVKKQKDSPPPAEEVELFKEAEFIPDAAEQLPDYGDLSDQTDGYVDWKTV